MREGELADIGSYPVWAQELVESCADAKERVARHPVFCLMRDAELNDSQSSTFLVGLWPVIEQFPQYMAQNLLKVQYGRTRGHDEARRYLIRNMRVEQNHADHWLNWARACGVSQDDLLHGEVPPETHALSHWCWHTCERDSLAAGMAATNYAIEGVTGEASVFICASGAYEQSFPPEDRAKAMKWLKLHAKYDDTHPWEALEIICAVMGTNPTPRGVSLIRSRTMTSYEYLRLTLDRCLEAEEVVSQPMPLLRSLAPPLERRRATERPSAPGMKAIG